MTCVANYYWKRDERDRHRWLLCSRRSRTVVAQVQRYVFTFRVDPEPYLYFSVSVCQPFGTCGRYRTLAEAKARAERAIAWRNARKRGQVVKGMYRMPVPSGRR